MLRRIFISKLFILFTSLFIIGFFIGYDYAHITYEPDNTDYLSQPSDIYSQIEKNSASQPENTDMNFTTQNNIDADDSSFPETETSDNAESGLKDYVKQNDENIEKPDDVVNPSEDSSVNPMEPSN